MAEEGPHPGAVVAPDQDAPEAQNGRAGGRALHFTSLFVTINLQRNAASIGGLSVFERYLDDVLMTEQHLPSLLGVQERDLQSVEFIEPAIEVSPGRQLVHAHFTVNILHTTRIFLGGMQRRWQRFLAMTLPFRNHGVYVNIQLLDGRPENYALKQQRA